MTGLDHSRIAFLRELTGRHAHLLVWKHLDRALLGRGDVDAAAPAEDTDAIAADAVGIAPGTLDATHVIACNHVADKRLHFFVQPHRLPELFEFDMCTQPSRGLAPWADPRAMVPLSVVQDNGIRRLRPGAEAVVSLVYHGLSQRGRDRLTNDEREIVHDGLRSDLSGAEEACRTLPPRPARQPLRNLIAEVSKGSWDANEARRAFRGFVISGPAHPRFTLRRVLYRARLAGGGECLMSDLARHHDRKVPVSGLTELLSAARASGHRVIEL
jgi:hypothetical protein